MAVAVISSAVQNERKGMGLSMYNNNDTVMCTINSAEYLVVVVISKAAAAKS